MKRTTSPNGIRQIARREGVRLTVYRDSKGIPTVGVGHVVLPEDNLHVGDRISQAECDRFLAADLATAETAVNSYVKVPLSQNQFDALVSFVVNIGKAGFKTSQVVKRLNAKDYSGAAGAMMNWVKPPEITGRRKTEQKQFLTPDKVSTAAPLLSPTDPDGLQEEGSVDSEQKGNPPDQPPPDKSEGDPPAGDPSTSGAAPNATLDDKAMSPQLVEKESPSTFTKWVTGIKLAIGAAIASVSTYCGGSEVQTLVAQKAVENADRSVLPVIAIVLGVTIFFVGIGILLIWIASVFYDRSARRANALNQQKVEKAASQTENTVEYKK